MQMEDYYPCCGKSICEGCSYSSRKSGSNKCPFCNADRNKTEEERIQEMIRRVEANDAASICLLANFYYQGIGGFQQDHAKAIEHCVRAADLGFSKAHSNLAVYHQGGNMKKAKFHFEAAAMADTKWQDTTLESWSIIQEIWNELLSIGQLQHLLVVIMPCMN